MLSEDGAAPPVGCRAGRADERRQAATSARSVDDFAGEARRLVEEVDCQPPCALAAWAQGFVAGYDAACRAEVHRVVMELAESIALHSAESWAPVGRLSRARRIAKEVAEGAACAIQVRQTPDWPPVRVPGGGQ